MASASAGRDGADRQTLEGLEVGIGEVSGRREGQPMRGVFGSPEEVAVCELCGLISRLPRPPACPACGGGYG